MRSYKNFILVIWALIIVVAVALTLRATDTQKSRYYDVKVKAAELMLKHKTRLKNVILN